MLSVPPALTSSQEFALHQDTIKRTAKALTKPQRVELERASRDALGVVEWKSVRGLFENNWRKMLDRMCSLGLMKPYVHAGYEITDFGREVLSYR